MLPKAPGMAMLMASTLGPAAVCSKTPNQPASVMPRAGAEHLALTRAPSVMPRAQAVALQLEQITLSLAEAAGAAAKAWAVLGAGWPLGLASG